MHLLNIFNTILSAISSIITIYLFFKNCSHKTRKEKIKQTINKKITLVRYYYTKPLYSLN